MASLPRIQKTCEVLNILKMEQPPQPHAWNPPAPDGPGFTTMGKKVSRTHLLKLIPDEICFL